MEPEKTQTDLEIEAGKRRLEERGGGERSRRNAEMEAGAARLKRHAATAPARPAKPPKPEKTEPGVQFEEVKVTPSAKTVEAMQQVTDGETPAETPAPAAEPEAKDEAPAKPKRGKAKAKPEGQAAELDASFNAGLDDLLAK